MSTDADAVSEAARALSARRWDPAARLRTAVDTVVRRSADLDAEQRAAIEAAISGEVPGE
jgi:hypothetical protein